ncbi:hypothetical protein [Serratia oryzae]|uniref:Lipoprotein n=1 Tax=Serratia oryzae TaxID=2034155 RepID=A0A1S8CLS1_9GAMM|nr:hypothetical protein [Serratia oryzae]OMQ24394.1 hypothetical protein BMI79_06025 [Serratia oryzae]VXC90606.1 conserved exported hypothetical protein [Enterobacterales bacterium 8AC]
MKRKSKIILSAAVALTLTGCATGAPDTMLLQQGTVNVLGLASTDELTLSNIQKGEANALGSSNVVFDAVTAKGRKFSCQTLMMPSLNPLDKPTYGEFKCQPK